MDRHIKEYYNRASDETPHGNFHEVIALHEAPEISWKNLSTLIPELTRGWYELAYLSTQDRIDFTHDFWALKLPYRAGLNEFLDRFFASLDEIGVYITQKKFSDPHEIHLVYSLRDNSGFYRGALPISEMNLQKLQDSFPDTIFPADYLSFLQIHDGFCKTTDCTGIIPSIKISEKCQTLQSLIGQKMIATRFQKIAVNPKSLFPFYESFGMPYFQCFWSEWYPEQEMGNVYYSGEANTISDIFTKGTSEEIMAFPTYTDWLMFYLERIE